MASNAVDTAEQESDDLTTCCVCFEVYNKGNGNPNPLHVTTLTASLAFKLAILIYYGFLVSLMICVLPLTENGSFLISCPLPKVQSCVYPT